MKKHFYRFTLIFSVILMQPIIASDADALLLDLKICSPDDYSEQCNYGNGVSRSFGSSNAEPQSKSVFIQIPFELDSDQPTYKGLKIVFKAAEEMNSGALINQVFVIEGHTDASGTDDYNRDLSLRRAREIYRILVAEGVSRNRLQYEGYGEGLPIPGADPFDGRNRRVEFLSCLEFPCQR